MHPRISVVSAVFGREKKANWVKILWNHLGINQDSDYADNYTNNREKLRAKLKKLVSEGRIKIGMTKEECERNFGEPRETDTMISGCGKVRETSFYGNTGDVTLFYTNGILDNIMA